MAYAGRIHHLEQLGFDVPDTPVCSWVISIANLQRLRRLPSCEQDHNQFGVIAIIGSQYLKDDQMVGLNAEGEVVKLVLRGDE